MKRLSLTIGLGAALSLCVLGFSRPAAAVGTRTFELNTLDELSGGELQGTAVDSQGRVRAGLVLGTTPLAGSESVWSSLTLADGSVLLGTGNTGKVLRVMNGQVTTYADTGQLAVTSLAFDGQAVLAGTIPNGKVYRITGPNKVAVLASLPDTEHVWALAFDPKTRATYAATGPEGKLFRIDATGRAQVYFDSDEPHLLSLAVAGDGTVYAGSSGRAILYRITGPGRAAVMYDFEGNDVKALALAPNGLLYAIANAHKTPPKVPRSQAPKADDRAEPTNVAKSRPQPGEGRLVRFYPDGRAEQMLHDKDTHFQCLAIGADGIPHVGTADQGKVFAVDDAHTAVLMADTEGRQVGALQLTGTSRFVVTSDPAVFHEVRSVGGPDSLWMSKVLDAGMRARFGQLAWQSTGPVELSTRTGNTEKPDATWSAWSAPLAAPGAITSPPGRYLQLRARFSRDPRAIVRELRAFFVTDNARAVITSIDTSSGSSSSSRDMPASGAVPSEPTAKVKLTWKVDNPDNDELRYRLWYMLEGTNTWRPMFGDDQVVNKTNYEWDTSGLPEGRYRVRVEASDELVNPLPLALKHSLESASFVVDNTPPALVQLALVGRRVRGKVVDGVGPVARIDVSVDPYTKLWYPFFPQDGVFDEATEEFDFDLTPLVGTSGSRLVAVRAFDARGNSVVRTIEVR